MMKPELFEHMLNYVENPKRSLTLNKKYAKFVENDNSIEYKRIDERWFIINQMIGKNDTSFIFYSKFHSKQEYFWIQKTFLYNLGIIVGTLYDLKTQSNFIILKSVFDNCVCFELSSSIPTNFMIDKTNSKIFVGCSYSTIKSIMISKEINFLCLDNIQITDQHKESKHITHDQLFYCDFGIYLCNNDNILSLDVVRLPYYAIFNHSNQTLLNYIFVWEDCCYMIIREYDENHSLFSDHLFFVNTKNGDCSYIIEGKISKLIHIKEMDVVLVKMNKIWYEIKRSDPHELINFDLFSKSKRYPYLNDGKLYWFINSDSRIEKIKNDNNRIYMKKSMFHLLSWSILGILYVAFF